MNYNLKSTPDGRNSLNKTPNSINTSLLTPCRRVGLSRKRRSSKVTPNSTTATQNKRECTSRSFIDISETSLAEPLCSEFTPKSVRTTENIRECKSRSFVNSCETSQPEPSCSELTPKSVRTTENIRECKSRSFVNSCETSQPEPSCSELTPKSVRTTENIKECKSRSFVNSCETSQPEPSCSELTPKPIRTSETEIELKVQPFVDGCQTPLTELPKAASRSTRITENKRESKSRSSVDTPLTEISCFEGIQNSVLLTEKRKCKSQSFVDSCKTPSTELFEVTSDSMCGTENKRQCKSQSFINNFESSSTEVTPKSNCVVRKKSIFRRKLLSLNTNTEKSKENNQIVENDIKQKCSSQVDYKNVPESSELKTHNLECRVIINRLIDEDTTSRRPDFVSKTISGAILPSVFENYTNEKLLKEIEEAKLRIKNKEETLASLKREKLYRTKNDLNQLKTLKEKWLDVCQNALEDLLMATKNRNENCNSMENLLVGLNIPNALVKYEDGDFINSK